MTNEEKLRRIEKLYRHEKEFCREMTNIDKQINELLKRKRKLQRCASGAHKYRNTLVNEVYSPIKQI